MGERGLSATADAPPRALRAGIVGLGVGEQHLKSYRRDPACEVVAVCDIDPAQLDVVQRRYDIPRGETDWRRVTEAPDIDVVSICSYDDGHAAQVVSALSHGKHVMVEKPVVLFRRELEAVAAAHAVSGRQLTSNLILRRSPRFIELKRRVDAGELGEVFHVEGDYVHDILWKITHGWRARLPFYSVLYGGGIHLIDLMRWLVGREITEIAAMGSGLLAGGSGFRYHDTVVAMLRFAGGATAKSLTTLGPRHPKFHALRVYGTRATFVNDLPDAHWYTGDGPDDHGTIDAPYPGMAKGDLLPDFLAAVRAGRESAVTARDVFRVMDVCLTGQEAIEAGRTLPVRYTV